MCKKDVVFLQIMTWEQCISKILDNKATFGDSKINKNEIFSKWPPSWIFRQTSLHPKSGKKLYNVPNLLLAGPF